MTMCLTFMSFAVVSPKIKASYSASILVALNSQHTEYATISPCGDFSITTKPVPFTLEPLLVYKD